MNERIQAWEILIFSIILVLTLGSLYTIKLEMEKVQKAQEELIEIVVNLSI